MKMNDDSLTYRMFFYEFFKLRIRILILFLIMICYFVPNFFIYEKKMSNYRTRPENT